MKKIKYYAEPIGLVLAANLFFTVIIQPNFPEFRFLDIYIAAFPITGAVYAVFCFVDKMLKWIRDNK